MPRPTLFVIAVALLGSLAGGCGILNHDPNLEFSVVMGVDGGPPEPIMGNSVSCSGDAEIQLRFGPLCDDTLGLPQSFAYIFPEDDGQEARVQVLRRADDGSEVALTFHLFGQEAVGAVQV